MREWEKIRFSLICLLFPLPPPFDMSKTFFSPPLIKINTFPKGGGHPPLPQTQFGGVDNNTGFAPPPTTSPPPFFFFFFWPRTLIFYFKEKKKQKP